MAGGESRSQRGLPNTDPAELMAKIRQELSASSELGDQVARARASLDDVLRRSIESLESNPDIVELDVPMSLWGCLFCGFIAEDEQPDVCPVCGALGPEFEWFGPFCGGNQNLGRLRRQEILDTMSSIVVEVEEALSGVDDATASRKPSPQEWCANEVLAHMLETDRLFAVRVRFLLEDDSGAPMPRPMPPWKLHEGKGYESGFD